VVIATPILEDERILAGMFEDRVVVLIAFGGWTCALPAEQNEARSIFVVVLV
jgi:hypothetical protein|tara:strand:+ start:937 stop:1092 length:156 start_codon:yes stop_codon:yes gene_type:complete